MDLTKAALPDSVEVSGRHYRIRTGHSYWFQFARMIEERQYLSSFDIFYVRDVPEDRQAGVEALAGFYSEPGILPRSTGEGGERVLDYAIDADLIYAAIFQCYGVDLFERQIHWHKVRAMIAGLTGTRLNEIISYRTSNPGKDRGLARMKRAWALPEKVSKEDEELLGRFSEQFHNAQF
jgi:hypothetical protein